MNPHLEAKHNSTYMIHRFGGYNLICVQRKQSLEYFLHQIYVKKKINLHLERGMEILWMLLFSESRTISSSPLGETSTA